MADLMFGAQYLAGVWARAQLPCADLCASDDAARVLGVTDTALKLARKPPLAPALLQRHAILDRIAREHTGPRIVEIAAGLSPRGAAMTRDRAGTYVEVDLPAMSAAKRRLLERTEAGRAALARLTLVAGDATALDLAPLVAGEATLVMAEGLCMYLPGDARRKLFASIAALGRGCPALSFAFDLTPASEEPPAGLTGRVLGALYARFSGGARIERDARTRRDVLDELQAAGFSESRAIAARDVARAWGLPHADVATPTVVFTASARETGMTA